MKKLICFLIGHKGKAPTPNFKFLGPQIKRHVVGFYCERCGARVEFELKL